MCAMCMSKVLDGLSYIETLDDWKTVTQSGDLHFTGETDRIYLDTPPQLSIVDPAWERRIVADQPAVHARR